MSRQGGQLRSLSHSGWVSDREEDVEEDYDDNVPIPITLRDTYMTKDEDI